jgi:gliding motility-associated-like protein
VVTQLQLLPEPVLIRNRQICDGDSIEINGIWQNTAGVYDAVFAGANGCDSIVRTNLVVVPSAFASRTIQLCPGGVTFIGGAPVSAPGVYTDTVPAFSGCDSILTITVVVLPELRDTVDQQICAGDSILAGGSWQSASGEYLDTLLASGGCDSIVLTRLNVVPDSYQELDLLLCSGDSVLLGEGPVAFWTDSSGTYTVNMNSAAGCDSTVRYNVALQPIGRDTLVVQTCEGGGVFAGGAAGGAFQTSPGFYTDTLVGAQGCDSVLVTELQLLPTYNDTVSLDACLGDSVFLAGAWQSLPGSYTDFGTTVLGCDSITTTILQFLPEAYDADTLRACLGDSVFLGGAWQSAGGVFVDTISGGASCDTIRSTTLLFIQDSYSQTLLLCEGDSMFVGGAWQDVDGLFVDTFANSLGCDSLVFTTLLVSPREAYFVERILCAGDSAFLAGNWQSAAGIYVDTFANSLGCDSIITSQLSFTPYYYTQDTITICEGDSIPGIPLTGGSGAAINARRDGSVTYVDTLTASGGCDSLVEITVIEVPSSIGAASITLCAGDSILLGGQWVATPGFYVDTLLNAGGCDSINFVTLSVVDTFQQFFSAEICEGDSVFAGGVWVSTTGLYSDTLTASTGCDSILYLDLTVRPSPVVLLPVELCVGDSVLLLGQWIDGPAVLDDTLSTAFGCDSIRRFVVDTVPVLRNRIDVGICDGDSAFVAGNWENTSGTYSQRFASASGCDSIVTWTLTVYPTYVQGVNVELCAGDSVLAGGAWQTMPGVYADVFTSVRGCDSTVLTTVSVRPSTGSALSASICVGDSAFFAGQWYASPGTYTAVYAAANGCDSVVSFTLTSTSGFDVPITVDACAGDSVFVAGAWQTAAGIYVDSLTANGGCDSVVTSTVVLHPSYADTAALSICAGDSVFLAGAWRSIPGIYTDFGTTVLGCDSSNSVLLEVLPGSGSSTLVEICPGDSVFAGGTWQTASGLYADTLVSALGCDSIASTTILVSPVLTDTVYASVCDGFAYYAGGAWQSTAGVYLDSSLAPGGCLQRTVTLLSINPSPVVNRSFQICTGDSIYLAGAWRNSNGTYTETTSTVAGCDSVVHNALQVLEPILDTVYTGFCEGDSVFAGGAWQTETGFYTDVYTAASGCDSIVTTALDVAPVYILEIDVELCEGEFFSIGGDSVQVGGEFFMVLPSSQGCDSVLIYDLKFLPLAVNEEARSICEGDSSLVFGQWLSAAGTYSDTVLVPGACPEIERVVLDVRPRVALQAMDTLLCLGDSVQLSTIGGNNWQWAPDEALSCLDCPNPWVAPTSTTVFTVSTTDNCATNPTAEALVEVYPPPSVEAVDEEVVLAPGQSFTLSASGEGNGPLLYWWTAGDQVICTDCPEYTVAPQSGTTYTVWVEDGLGCTASDELRLGVDDACIDGQFQAANAFSPNGDGFNDRFVIEYSGPATVDWVRIYNRWGELLFETEDPRALWDGHFRGKLVDPGVYVYTLEGTCEGEQPFFFVGNVTMLR